MNSQPLTACTGPRRIQTSQDPSTEKGKWIQGPTPNQEAVCHGYLLVKGKAVFSSEVSLGMSITLQGRPHTQD